MEGHHPYYNDPNRVEAIAIPNYKKALAELHNRMQETLDGMDGTAGGDNAPYWALHENMIQHLHDLAELTKRI